jgi:hypothetical protein
MSTAGGGEQYMMLLEMEELEELSAPSWAEWAAGFGLGLAIGAAIALT